MLEELESPRQIPGEPARRWFSDEMFDLIVWLSPDDRILGFQLCYSKQRDEHALTWLEERGFTHNRIDDGEGMPSGHKMTPILIPDGALERDRLIGQFRNACSHIDPIVAAFVGQRLTEYPA